MKYVQFPGETFSTCEECFTPIMEMVLLMAGETPAEGFDAMVEQMDFIQMRDFGHQDVNRPDIVDEAPGFVCKKCNREGAAA